MSASEGRPAASASRYDAGLLTPSGSTGFGVVVDKGAEGDADRQLQRNHGRAEMNGHGLTATTRSPSSSTTWVGISSASKYRTGRSNAGLVFQSPPTSANTSARVIPTRSRGISRSLSRTQSSLQPTPTPHAERQLRRVELLAAVPNRAVGRAVDDQIGVHAASLVANLQDA
jgi:hypothetical protein